MRMLNGERMRNFKHIGLLVKNQREKLGLSQAALSLSIGYKNGQFISNVERGQCSLPAKKIGLMSAVLMLKSDKITKAMRKDYSDYLNLYSE